MKKNVLPILFLSCFFVFLFSCFLVLPVQASVFDSIYENLGIFTTETKLPGGQNAGLVDIVISIINIILTFLAILFVILIIYGGFTYMTAGGSSEKTKKAIGIIRDAVIGVIIIALSYAIVNFVIIKILEAVR